MNSNQGALNAALNKHSGVAGQENPIKKPPRVGRWELCELPEKFCLDHAPVLIYEEYKENTPDKILNNLHKTGFGDKNRLPYVKKFHLAFTAEDHIIWAKTSLRKVCSLVLFASVLTPAFTAAQNRAVCRSFLPFAKAGLIGPKAFHLQTLPVSK